MSGDALYVYGVVKCELDSDWQETGIKGQKVYLICKGNFSALIHDCQEEPYLSENPEEIKQMIIAHNRILDQALEDFGGVIPLSFNTIIKGGNDLPSFRVEKWLSDDQEKLERIWRKIKGKREYGIRVYYAKNKLLEESSKRKEVKKIEDAAEGKGEGLGYLLQEKAKSKVQEIFQNKIGELKQEFYNGIKKITEEIVANPSRISLEEEKDLLLSLSVLIEEKQIEGIKEFLEQKKAENFSYYVAGPFAPYSFVENVRE